jgi:hypothetical protein
VSVAEINCELTALRRAMQSGKRLQKSNIPFLTEDNVALNFFERDHSRAGRDCPTRPRVSFRLVGLK